MITTKILRILVASIIEFYIRKGEKRARLASKIKASIYNYN